MRRLDPECIHLVGVSGEHDVTTSASGLEHKVRRSLRQKLSERAGLCCSKPVELSNLPPQLARISGRRTQVLPEDSADAPCLGV